MVARGTSITCSERRIWFEGKICGENLIRFKEKICSGNCTCSINLDTIVGPKNDRLIFVHVITSNFFLLVMTETSIFFYPSSFQVCIIFAVSTAYYPFDSIGPSPCCSPHVLFPVFIANNSHRPLFRPFECWADSSATLAKEHHAAIHQEFRKKQVERDEEIRWSKV